MTLRPSLCPYSPTFPAFFDKREQLSFICCLWKVLKGDGQTPLDWAAYKGHSEIIEMLLSAGGKCIVVGESLSNATEELTFDKLQANLDQYLAAKEERQRQEKAARMEGKFQTALGVPARVASALAMASSAPETTKQEMIQRFEDGRLPCAFPEEPFWKSILGHLNRFETEQAQRRSAAAEEQRKRQEASNRIKAAQKSIRQLQTEVTSYEKAVQAHANKEKALQAELEERKEVESEVAALRAFAELAVPVEENLASQLEAQLAKDREGLLTLHQQGGPKLSLLLNCFGAEPITIQALGRYSSMDLAMFDSKEVQSLIASLPQRQQSVVLYTQERLIHGKPPFGQHDCALCSCETPEEMSAFCQEQGLTQVTPEIIRKTGASGRGALLFLTSQQLQLDISQHALFNRARADHRKR